MGMNIEVEARTIYTVYLTDEDVVKVKKRIKDHEDGLPSLNMKNNIAWAVARLYESGEISLYDEGKAEETDIYTDIIRWSEYEDRTPEEILEGIE